ncbi:MAG: autotransporter outer membrane beta-barrel domain-containing protein [Hyphomicrobiaceae bacterium]
MRDFKFSASLSELRRDAQDAEQRRQQKLLADAGLGFVSEGFADRASQMRQGLDVWVEGQISKYDDGLGGYDRDGDFRVLYVGADYALAPGVLVGALVQVDDTREDVNKSDLTGKVEGTGWMVGPYVGIKLTDNLFLDARAAYGTSSNDIWLDDSAAGYRSASFDTDRWLTTATLTGNEYIGNFRFSPQLGLAYGREWYGDYYNSIGQVVEGRDISIARINATLEVGYRFDLVDGTMIEPHVSISGIANFSGDDLIIAGEIIDPNENRAKIEGGFIVQTREGYAIRAAAAYDGIGQSDFEAYSGSLWLNVPLN